jgi:hypothetical protein
MRCRPEILPLRTGLILPFVLLLATAGPAADAKKSAAPPAKTFDAAVAAKFAQVEEWRGVAEFSQTSGVARGNNSYFFRRQEEHVTHSTFALRRDLAWKWDPQRGSFRWKGDGEVRGQKTIDFEDRTVGGSFAGAFEQWREIIAGAHPWKDWHFEIFLPGRDFTLHPGSPGDLPLQRLGTKRYNNGTWNDETIDQTVRSFLLAFRLDPEDRTRHWAQLANGPGVITFTTAKTIPGKVDTRIGDTVIRSRVTLYPVYDDVEVEVTIPGYADWLPQGNIESPKKPGNALAARAVLKSKTGRTKQLPEVDHFRFELLDTSREPGVCLNWPLNANDSDHDFRLANFSAEISGDQMKAAQKFFAAWGLASSGDYDLASMPPGGLPPMSFGEVAEDGQKAELRAPPKDKAGQPYAEAAIECYDFGAKSELRVVCVLKDGREIIGLMKGDGGEQDLVRLPKRAGPDWVAEKWRKDHDAVKLAASDDEEKVEGQRHHGDGFTLYEEYRGWVVNGRHVTGDPKRKDFFVLNQRGADFRGGIDLFRRLAQLRVHATLRDGEEMSEDQRRMNANRRDAPHRVAQHGVILARGNGMLPGATVGIDGADPAKAFRPRIVSRIFMEPSEAGRGTSRLSIASGVQAGLSPRDAEWAWDRAVAHELLHSVGVEHHGERLRQKVSCYFQGAAMPTNPTGRPRYATYWDEGASNYMQEQGKPPPEAFSEDRGPTIVLRWEDTRRDVFEDFLAEYERRRQELTAYYASEAGRAILAADSAKLAHTGKTAEWWSRYMAADYATSLLPLRSHVLWVGATHGTDSGDELCVMKYYFATAYRIAGQEDAYYLLRPGANRAGRQICRSPAGTGGNAPGHSPQPRFGDAAPGRGNCFAQICPNDAIPPR